MCTSCESQLCRISIISNNSTTAVFKSNHRPIEKDCLQHFQNLSCEAITSIWMQRQTSKYFSMFSMELFHVIISIIFFSQPRLCVDFTTNLNKLRVSFNLLIRCCGSGYLWRIVIDWPLWCSCENPNSPVSTSDVTPLKPSAEATECIREAHCNSMHTLQLVRMAQYVP